MLRARLLGPVVGVLAAVVLALSPLGPRSVEASALATPPGRVSARTAPAADIERIWLRDCAVCHGGDGSGTPRGPDLRSTGRAEADYMLSTGRMPISDPSQKLRRSPPKYAPDVLAGLVDYVAALGPGGVDIPEVSSNGDVARGGELFRAQCAACHSWSGVGGALLEREAPRLQPATPVQIAEAVRVGPGTMPAFGEAALDKSELDDVVAYVRYLDHPRDVGGLALWHLGPLVEGGVIWVVGIGILLFLARRTGTRT